MKLLLPIFVAFALYGQYQTPLTVLPTPADPSALRLRESGSNGANWTSIQAPSALGSNQNFTWLDGYGTAGQCISGDGAGVLSWAWCQQGERVVSDYNWSQNLGTLAAGPSTVTITFGSGQCPAAATDTAYRHRVYEALMPSIYEVVAVTGGTCARGGSGTLEFAHSAIAFTTAIAASASDGWQEALFSVADSVPVRLRAAIGSYHVYSDIVTEDRAATIICDGPSATLVPRANGVLVFNVASPSSIRIEHCGFDNHIFAHTNTTAIYTNNPDGSTYGGRITNNTIDSFHDGIHMVTGYLTDTIGNRIQNPTNAAIWLENVDTGDGGIGLVQGNNMFCSGTCRFGLLWNGPGALQYKSNGHNGFTEQIHLEPKHGCASAANSGADTVITWQDCGDNDNANNLFRPSHVGKPIWIGSSTCVVDTYTSSTVLRCNGENLGTIATTRYYVQPTGQVQVMQNLIDGGGNTLYGIRWVGDTYLLNSQIEQNFIANYTVNNFVGISLEGNGLKVGGVANNSIESSSTPTGTVGISITAGDSGRVAGNQVYGFRSGISVASPATNIDVGPNFIRNTVTDPLLNTSTTARFRESVPLTYTQLNALSSTAGIANGSEIFCSNCKQTVSGCATGGTGAVATRLNSAWQCQDATSGVQPWVISGSNIYYQTGAVSIGTASAFGDLTVVPASGGANLYLADSTITTKVQLNAESGYGELATYSNHDLLFGSDSTTRMRLQANGMLRPEAHDTYDLGLTGTRFRTVYARAGEFYKSGGTSSSDYVTTRKLTVWDQSGASGGWDVQATTSGSASDLFIRDNAGVNAIKFVRKVASVATDYADVYVDLQPDTHNSQKLGDSGRQWSGIYVTDIHTSGGSVYGHLDPAATNTYTLGSSSRRWAETNTVKLDATGTVSLTGSTITATSTFSSDIIPTTDGSYSLGTTSFRFGQLAVYNINFNGLWTGDLVPASTNSYALGTAGNIWSAIRAGQLYASTLATFTGATITAPSGTTGLNTTLTCPAGQAVKSITTSGGFVTAVSCAIP